MKSKSIESGFTLVELLVTILIFSFSISIMLAGLDQGRLAWSTLNKKVESVSNLQDRYSWLSMLFSGATATQFSNEYGVAVPFFYGDKDSVKLLSNSPILNGPGNYSSIVIWFEKSDYGYSLFYAEKSNSDPYYNSDEVDKDFRKLELIKLINTYEIRYLAPIHMPVDGTNIPIEDKIFFRYNPTWLDFFYSKKETSMPMLVNIKMSFLNKSNIDWYFPVTAYSTSSHIDDEVYKK